MADEVRHSQALEAELIRDPVLCAEQEVQNGLRQFQAVEEMVHSFLDPDRPFRLRPSHLLHLHRVVLMGLSGYAGNWRPSGIEIQGSRHAPPDPFRIPELIEEMCDYVNDNWKEKSPLHLASYVMWRLNWIHPFTDGNGRTSRAISYLILCLRLGYLLPGKLTIPEQIAKNKTPYYQALEAADVACAEDQSDCDEGFDGFHAGWTTARSARRFSVRWRIDCGYQQLRLSQPNAFCRSPCSIEFLFQLSAMSSIMTPARL